MRVILVGADNEENLGVAMVGMAARAAGHEVEVLAFNEPKQINELVPRILARRPDVVGLSIQFQHRAHDFVLLARRLRAENYSKHITCGGQVPTLAYEQILGLDNGIDSVVLHEGEQSFEELLAALHADQPLTEIPGLAVRDDQGKPMRTHGRRLVDDLDQLPFPWRYRSHSLHLGIPFIPIMGGRGCWGSCSFCSISAYYRDARQYGGGRLLRQRSPENVATEMAFLAQSAGGKAIFCFHDDNFLLPRPADSLQRVQRIRQKLDELGIGKVAMIGKSRPECLTPQLAKDLRRLGVIRLYVGVENVSARGAEHLRRQKQTAHVQDALLACQEAGIFGCYNLLLFEPQTCLADIEENIAFIRQHSTQPVNFCRAEPYHHTLLHRELSATGNMGGSYLGYDYRLQDDRAELLFRICAAAFRQRNFDPHGVHNRYMGLGYNQKIIEYFYEDGATARLFDLEAQQLTRTISLETADFLEEALALARDIDLDDRDRIERETALLGLRIADADHHQHRRLDTLYQRMSEHSRKSAKRFFSPAQLVKRAKQVAQGVTVASWLAAATVTVQGCDDRSVADPVPPDAGLDRGKDTTVVDMLPPDAALDSGVDQAVDQSAVDRGIEWMVVDPLPPDGMVVDMLPPDSGSIADPPPPDSGSIADPLPPDGGISKLEPVDESPKQMACSAPAGQWRDVTPRRALRSMDLPLYDSPVIALSTKKVDQGIQVQLTGGPAAVSIRWEGDGLIEGEGREVLWQPDSLDDQLRVGVRTKGGIAVMALRAKDTVAT